MPTPRKPPSAPVEAVDPPVADPPAETPTGPPTDPPAGSPNPPAADPPVDAGEPDAVGAVEDAALAGQSDRAEAAEAALAIAQKSYTRNNGRRTEPPTTAPTAPTTEN